jgi:solute carrier family 25 S-adenosylmethionine transporter 26
MFSPSSALYFGAYETTKTALQTRLAYDENSLWNRLWVFGLSAASGNILSSAAFVPKELIKQQMQYTGTNMQTTVLGVLRKDGPSGLYRGYQATLIRNIPSAVLRFAIYEEIKRVWNQDEQPAPIGFSWKLFIAGAVAGAVASGVMTPVDVLKTRLSTGTCPVDARSCFQYVVEQEGWKGLYAGAGSRMAFSGLFSAIGFGSFEAAKCWLGVSDRPDASSQQKRHRPMPTPNTRS